MLCSNCNNSDLKIIKSATNSKYFYCESCNKGLETAYKQASFDEILEIVSQTLKQSKFDCLKIQLELIESNLILLINDVKLKSVYFRYKLSKMDSYHLENFIYALVEDNCTIDNSKVDVLVFT